MKSAPTEDSRLLTLWTKIAWGFRTQCQRKLHYQIQKRKLARRLGRSKEAPKAKSEQQISKHRRSCKSLRVQAQGFDQNLRGCKGQKATGKELGWNAILLIQGWASLISKAWLCLRRRLTSKLQLQNSAQYLSTAVQRSASSATLLLC